MNAGKRIPFDLERALAGDALVTRGGRSVTNFRLADKSDTRYPFLATIHTPGKEPRDEWFTMNGQFFYGDTEGCNDLFMVGLDQPKHRFAAAPEPTAQQPIINVVFRCEANGIVGTTSHQSIHSVSQEDDGSFTVELDYWPTPTQQPAQQPMTEDQIMREIPGIGWDDPLDAVLPIVRAVEAFHGIGKEV